MFTLQCPRLLAPQWRSQCPLENAPMCTEGCQLHLLQCPLSWEWSPCSDGTQASDSTAECAADPNGREAVWSHRACSGSGVTMLGHVGNC